MSVKLAHLNDFIAPAPLCIKPLLDAKAAAAAPAAAAGADADSGKAKSGGNKGSTVRIELELDADMKQSIAALQSVTSSFASGAGVASGHFRQMRLDDVKKTATVSLNDCLACSGCVTSAETVLITAQSTDEFLTKLKAIRAVAAAANDTATGRPRVNSNVMADGNAPAPAADVKAPLPSAGAAAAAAAAVASSSSSDVSTAAPAAAAAHKLCVVTLSPHSRTALAHYFAPGASGGDLSFAKRLTTLLHRIGVHALIDASVGLDIALIEARNEFIEKFKAATAAPAAAAAAAASIGGDAKAAKSVPAASPAVLPLLAGECPGWVCYAEKKEGKTVLPHIAATKSPQQIIGSLVKSHVASKLGVKPNEIYHVTVMPCYDKKLEGARDDFWDETNQTRDVDCVLTTDELKQIVSDVLISNQDTTTATAAAASAAAAMAATGADPSTSVTVNQLFSALVESPLDALSNVSPDQSTLYVAAASGGASGGYMDYIFRYAAKQLFGVDVPADKPLHFTATRNPDMKEIDLKVDGKVVLSFAVAYGFRNIPTLMSKIKNRTCKYHYVEIMACPSGCLNGGGQIRAAESKNNKSLVAALSAQYHSRAVRDPALNPIVQSLYKEWILPHQTQAEASASAASASAPAARPLLQTSYHAVQSIDQLNPLLTKW